MPVMPAEILVWSEISLMASFLVNHRARKNLWVEESGESMSASDDSSLWVEMSDGAKEIGAAKDMDVGDEVDRRLR